MTTCELFKRLVQDARDISDVVSELIEQGFSNSNLLLLKEYLDKTNIKGTRLILPPPFTSISSSESNEKIRTYVFEYISKIGLLAFDIFSEDILTARILSKTSKMYDTFKEFYSK